MLSELKSFRQKLHANPELSGEEKETQQRIRSFLKEHTGLEGKSVGRFGTIYPFEFGEGPHLLVRVDIDALPIQEINTFEHKSQIEGVSHKCGHDGHATIGIGLVKRLQEEPLETGKVTVLFQPAEEDGTGAKSVLDDDSFKPEDYDYTVALHNIPGRSRHEIIYKSGSFTPAVHSMIISLEGKTSHAAEPLKGNNPSYAIADIIAFAKENEVLDEDDPDYHLLTPIYAKIGSKDYGISAGYGEIHFTIRSWTVKSMEGATEKLEGYVNKVAEEYELTLKKRFTDYFATNRNDEYVVKHIAKAATTLSLKATEKPKPFPWGEDFGLFTQKIKGAMFGLGAGEETPALHNPDYDFPDDITETGINMFYETAKSICKDV